MCQSCKDEHHKTLDLLKGKIEKKQAIILIVLALLGFAIFTPCIAGSMSKEGAGKFCCLVMLMMITPFGGFWLLYWLFQVFQNAKE